MPFKDKQKAKEKNAEYQRKWYSKNRTKQKSRVNKRKEKIRCLIAEYKQCHPCTQCQESHPACLDFHHCDNDKEFNIGESVAAGYSWEKIMSEILKCVVLCRNCHAKEHWRE